MRCLSQYEDYFGLFSQAGKEIDEDMKKEKEIKVKRQNFNGWVDI